MNDWRIQPYNRSFNQPREDLKGVNQ